MGMTRSNPGPPVSEATSLPTVPQLPPWFSYLNLFICTGTTIQLLHENSIVKKQWTFIGMLNDEYWITLTLNYDL